MLTNESVCDQRKVLHLAIHQRGEGQVVEQVCEVFPDVGVPVLPQTLVIEPVHLHHHHHLSVKAPAGDFNQEKALEGPSP